MPMPLTPQNRQHLDLVDLQQVESLDIGSRGVKNNLRRGFEDLLGLPLTDVPPKTRWELKVVDSHQNHSHGLLIYSSALTSAWYRRDILA